MASLVEMFTGDPVTRHSAACGKLARLLDSERQAEKKKEKALEDATAARAAAIANGEGEIESLSAAVRKAKSDLEEHREVVAERESVVAEAEAALVRVKREAEVAEVARLIRAIEEDAPKTRKALDAELRKIREIQAAADRLVVAAVNAASAVRMTVPFGIGASLDDVAAEMNAEVLGRNLGPTAQTRHSLQLLVPIA